MLGVTLQPSHLGGTNYAYGGATQDLTNNPFPYSLLTQANQYLASNTASANTLYVIAGGGNDARAVLAGNAGGGSDDAGYAANVGAIVDELQAAGAQHIVVWNTPNLGLAPAVAAAGGAALGASARGGYEPALATRLLARPASRSSTYSISAR